MTHSGQPVIIVGGGPLALVTALMLHRRGISCTVVGEAPPTNPPLNPELMLIGGDDSLPPLFQKSLESWRGLAEALGLPPLIATTSAQDLATSPGRVAKLREEAMLDALGGEPVLFTDTPPATSPMSLGAKTWAEAPRLTDTTLGLLQQAVQEAGIPRLLANPAVLAIVNSTQPQITLADGSVHQAKHIVFTSARALRKVLPPLGLALPLRPARGHVIGLQTSQPHRLPLMLQRLQRGHLFLVPMDDNRLDIHYDAINDPAQSTFNINHSASLVTALQQHVGRLVPALASAQVTGINTVRHWLTPDFLPAVGPWPGLPGVLVGTGWGGRGTAFAAGAAAVLAEAITTGEITINVQPLAPNRFANGLWQIVKQPGSLTWQEPATETDNSLMMPKPEYMQKVNLTETPKPQYANNVQQVGKTVTENAGRRAATIQTRSKPKITTAAIKNS